jgi:hypothetical protein
MILRRNVLGITLLTVVIVSFGGWVESQTSWTEKLGYKQDEIYPIKLQDNSIPLVEVRVNGSPLWVIFDTGCSTGFSLTSAVEDKIEHTITGKSRELYPDGSYRGETRLATIASLEVFGDEYSPVKTSFAVKQLRLREQNRGVNFQYPQTVKLGTDVIRDFLFTIDKIGNKLFLSDN